MSQTNAEISKLFAKQTYRERITMANDLHQWIVGWLDKQRSTSHDISDPDIFDVAMWFDGMAVQQEKD